MFTLTKWYVDCVDTRGRSAIVYWSRIAWQGFAFSIHSLSIHEPGAEPIFRSSFADAPPPSRHGRQVIWHGEGLGCDVKMDAHIDPFGIRLFESRDGTLDWRCEAASASVTCSVPVHASIDGAGYAECLTTNVLPWRLPIEELRWGRWICEDASRSIVWIDWRGPHPLTEVFVDGLRQTGSSVTDEGVTTDAMTLTLSEHRRLHERSLSDLIEPLKPLARLLPKAWLAVRDCKLRSTGTTDTSDSVLTGWAIHEYVRFP